MPRSPSLIADTILEYQYGHDGFSSGVRVQVYTLSHEKTVVILSDINHGKSVTNAVEWIASLVRQEYDLDATSTVWIEHYPIRCFPDDATIEPSWDIVAFTWSDAANTWHAPAGCLPWARKPSWTHTNEAAVEALLSSVREDIVNGKD